MATITLAALLITLFALPIWGAIFARMAGGGMWAVPLVDWTTKNFGPFWGSAAGRVGEALTTLPIGIISTAAANWLLGSWFDVQLAWYWLALWFVVAWVWSYFRFEMGHGTTQGMEGYRNQSDDGRIDGNERIVRLLLPKGFDIAQPLYSWLCMGYKGMMVTLPLGPLALLGGILFPLGYHLGRRVEPGEPGSTVGNHGMAEMFGGMAVMVPTALALVLLTVVWLNAGTIGG